MWKYGRDEAFQKNGNTSGDFGRYEKIISGYLEKWCALLYGNGEKGGSSRGIVKLASAPYVSTQLDEQGSPRKVWIFPLQPLVEGESVEGEQLEEKISGLSDRELARYTEIKILEKEPRKIETVVYRRDPYLKEMVKRIAEGKCQFCGAKAPFIDRHGKPYLEEHHVKKLADGGNDVIENVVAVCPNCHRKIHILSAEEDVVILEKIAEEK